VIIREPKKKFAANQTGSVSAEKDLGVLVATSVFPAITTILTVCHVIVPPSEVAQLCVIQPENVHAYQILPDDNVHYAVLDIISILNV
jgi:hypothetical protein